MKDIWRPVAVYFTAAVPFVEGKGAVLLAKLLHLPRPLSSVLSIAGSYTPVPFLLYTKQGARLRDPKKKKLPTTFQKYVERYGCWALLVMIAVPFTGLGCWLGAILARMMHLDKHKSAVSIFIGNMIAVLLMTGCLSGIVALFHKILSII